MQLIRERKNEYNYNISKIIFHGYISFIFICSFFMLYKIKDKKQFSLLNIDFDYLQAGETAAAILIINNSLLLFFSKNYKNW